VDTTEDILVAAKVTNAVFPRHSVRAHSPCNKRCAGAQNRGETDPVESGIVTDVRHSTLVDNVSGQRNCVDAGCIADVSEIFNGFILTNCPIWPRHS
jgi:hypothetical protein